MVAGKHFFSNAQCNFAKDKVSSKCKNDKSMKKLNRKSASPPPQLFKKTCHCNILPPSFLISRVPPLVEVTKIYSPPPFKIGCPNYVIATSLKQVKIN